MRGKTVIEKIRNIKTEWKLAWVTTVVLGLLIHMPVLLGDYPNHDGLASMYFDQNMITSGRWFLTVACGFSSYFTLPWLIGILSLCFLGVGAAALVSFLGIQKESHVVLVSALLVSFPALASTYAYIFTADGYMLALAMILVALYVTKTYRFGFVWGGILIAFSMGCYQSYLAFAMILAIYGVWQIYLEEKKGFWKESLHYVYMGVLGVALYYIILRILLLVEGKKLSSYQGIEDMTETAKVSFSQQLLHIYKDFLGFAGNGRVLMQNLLGAGCMLVLLGFALWSLGKAGMLKKWQTYVLTFVSIVAFPICANMILLVSPGVTYHLLMRYQYVLIPILLIALIDRQDMGKWQSIATFMAGILVLQYAVADNIAYSNLQKKYEKTYGYCLRLLDRMEQTEGYETGMPVAMVGVINTEHYPKTDLTGKVTDSMIGMNGDFLVYTDDNYQSFFANYLGATIELVDDEKMEEIYHSAIYQAMPSFPENGCTQVVDGILYVKTEPCAR